MEYFNQKVKEKKPKDVIDFIIEKYPFNKNELELIHNINKVIPFNNLDPMVLYKYGLYVNSVASEIKNQNIKNVSEAYNKLDIKSRKDIMITSDEIMKLLNKKPGKYISDIFEILEKEILYRRLSNNKEDIKNYISNYCGGGEL